MDPISGMMLTNPGAEGRLVTMRSARGSSGGVGGPTVRSTARSGSGSARSMHSARSVSSTARSRARRDEEVEEQIDAFRSQKEELEAQLREIDKQLQLRAHHTVQMGRSRAERPFAMYPMSARTTWGAPSARDPPADALLR